MIADPHVGKKNLPQGLWRPFSLENSPFHCFLPLSSKDLYNRHLVSTKNSSFIFRLLLSFLRINSTGPPPFLFSLIELLVVLRVLPFLLYHFPSPLIPRPLFFTPEDSPCLLDMRKRCPLHPARPEPVSTPLPFRYEVSPRKDYRVHVFSPLRKEPFALSLLPFQRFNSHPFSHFSSNYDNEGSLSRRKTA